MRSSWPSHSTPTSAWAAGAAGAGSPVLNPSWAPSASSLYSCSSWTRQRPGLCLFHNISLPAQRQAFGPSTLSFSQGSEFDIRAHSFSRNTALHQKTLKIPPQPKPKGFSLKKLYYLLHVNLYNSDCCGACKQSRKHPNYSPLERNDFGFEYTKAVTFKVVTLYLEAVQDLVSLSQVQNRACAGSFFLLWCLGKNPYFAKSSLQYCFILCRTHHILSPLWLEWGEEQSLLELLCC